MKFPLACRQLAGKLNAGRFIRSIDGNPRQIASGYSLGVFIGLMPLVGVKAFMAMGIASLLKWNKLAAGIGVFNINPITAPFFFGLNYLVGKQITGCSHPFEFPEELSFNFLKELFLNSSEVLMTLAIGGFILGIPFAFFAYQLTYHTIKKYRN
jgi:uncharacterized protein (DUF2062 family)